MALNYSIHPQSSMGNSSSQSLPAPLLHRRQSKGERLAVGDESVPIDGPCELYLYSDEDIWIDCQEVETARDAAGSTMKLPAGVPMWFSLPKGMWVIETAAVA
jgi:ribosomal protein L16/L10AE